MDLKSRDHVIDCVSNDFYAIQDEIPKDKCYSSLDHCKECKNETIKIMNIILSNINVFNN